MSALAKILLSQGICVSGSDMTENAQTKELQALGCKIFIGHAAENVSGADMVVINGAIGAENPELYFARANNIPIITRDKLLAEISKNYRNVIAVAGCHGKSTTTAMIGAIFTGGGYDPTVHNGAVMQTDKGRNNLRLGGTDYFITEACEFKRSFLSLKPTVAVVTNIDADHLDCYTDINDIKTAFAEFCRDTDVVIKNAEDPNSADIAGRKKTVTVGINFGDIHTKNLHVGLNGKYVFELIMNEKIFGKLPVTYTVKLGIVGRHNVYNALCAAAAALSCGITLSVTVDALQKYAGISRRFETIKTIGNAAIICDYGHHPNEIRTTRETANGLYSKYLFIFQPHTFTRTLALFDDFVTVLSGIEELIIYKTYSARERPIAGGKGGDLFRAIRRKNRRVKYFANTEPLKKYIETNAGRYDAVILCGAGDVVSGEFLQ